MFPHSHLYDVSHYDMVSWKPRYRGLRWERWRIQSACGRRLRSADLARSWRRKLRSAWASEAERGWFGETPGGVSALDLATLTRPLCAGRLTLALGVGSRRARLIATSAAWTL